MSVVLGFLKLLLDLVIGLEDSSGFNTGTLNSGDTLQQKDTESGGSQE